MGGSASLGWGLGVSRDAIRLTPQTPPPGFPSWASLPSSRVAAATRLWSSTGLAPGPAQGGRRPLSQVPTLTASHARSGFPFFLCRSWTARHRRFSGFSAWSPEIPAFPTP